MMDKLTAISMVVFLALCTAVWHFRDKKNELERQLNQANQTIELLTQTQKASEEALAEARRLKEISDAENKRQRSIMEQALKDAGTWSDTAVPDSVRSLYRKDTAGDTVHSAEGAAAASEISAD